MASARAKKTFELMAENGGIVSTAMVEAGYSPVTANTPGKLTNSKAWKELMAEHLPDDLLAKKHHEFLNSKREDIGVKALDMGYKLKGSYAPEKSQALNLIVKGQIGDISQFDATRLEFEEKMKKQILDETV
jgi:hypothetical protein